MKCVNCADGKFLAFETRDAGDVIYRSRRCDGCGWVVVTEERASESLTTIPVAAREKKPRDWKSINARRDRDAINAARRARYSEAKNNLLTPSS